MRKFFISLYEKLFKINDTPQKIALGLGIGVFSGILPGTGPVAALFLALILRVNRASALIGCLLTNTWLSFVTFLLAIKTGSVILGVSWQQLRQDWNALFRQFSWHSLFKVSVLKVIFPVILGYLIIAICLGLISYLITLIIILKIKQGRR
jgi:uncharacterized protein (DUF2062 family)